jgi:hypothetical protein
MSDVSCPEQSAPDGDDFSNSFLRLVKGAPGGARRGGEDLK